MPRAESSVRCSELLGGPTAYRSEGWLPPLSLLGSPSIFGLTEPQKEQALEVGGYRVEHREQILSSAESPKNSQ